MTPIDTAELERLLDAAARHRTNVAQFLEAVCDRGHVTQDEFDAAHSDDEFAQDELRSMAEGLAREVLAHRKAEAWQPIETISRAAQDVLAERQRQISVEGWDDTHDDCNDKSELAQAAACYALSGTPADEAVFIHGRWKDPRDLFWPWTWDRSWWKPTDRRRDLVKAGALILAEIERLDRAALSSTGEKG